MNETQINILKQLLFLKGFEENDSRGLMRFVNRDDNSELIFFIHGTEPWSHGVYSTGYPADWFYSTGYPAGWSEPTELKQGNGYETLKEYLQNLKYARPVPLSPYVDYEGHE